MELYAQHAGPLALAASVRALAQSEIDTTAITDLIIVTCTGFAAPGVDLALIRGLKLQPTVRRTHVGFMGCHGAINGMRSALSIADSDANAIVLVVCVELCSLHYHFGTVPERIVANALFADGAAAIVGRAGPGVLSTASCVIPDSAAAMTWTVGDEGFAMTLSRQIPSLIGAHLRPWLDDWLSGQGTNINEVSNWAVHPGGPRILDAVERTLGIQELSHSRGILRDYGNMSSPTVLFLLERLRHELRAGPTVLLAFGPGLTAEAVLLFN
jgi:alpha-pyrone synthase